MMNIKLNPIAMAVIIATTASSGMLSIAQANTDPKLMEHVTLEQGKAISPQEENIISSAATKTLRHIAQARAAIHDKDPDAAKKELNQANTLLDIIQTSMPTTKVKDRIWIAKKHLEYENTDEVMPDLVPIYSSLDELTDYMPVKEAKSHLDKAKEHMKHGRKQPATEELDATDAALIYNEADLPLAATRHLVASAKSELEKGNTKEADQALKTAEDNVMYLSVDIDEPLASAKSSLWEASRNYANGVYDKAKAEVHQAITNLTAAAKSSDTLISQEASQMLKSAKQLEQKIGDYDTTLGGELKRLWQRTAALSERSVDYMATGWSRLRADDGLKSDLIEAKLYLNYAQIDQFTAKDDKRANTDLDQALRYVGKALATMGENKITSMDIKDEVDAINNSLQQLAKTALAEREETQFEQLGSQVSQVIQQL
jgi:hypothetical protein